MLILNRINLVLTLWLLLGALQQLMLKISDRIPEWDDRIKIVKKKVIDILLMWVFNYFIFIILNS